MFAHLVRPASLAVLLAATVVSSGPARAAAAPIGSDGPPALEALTRTADADETDPVWSPDGTRVLFTREDEDGRSLVAAGPDGSRPVVIAADAAEGDWSPDGRHVAFVREGALWVIAVGGVEATRLTEATAAAVFADPAWSPDGRSIATTVTPAGSGPAGQEIGLVPAGGGPVRLLTSFPDEDDAATWVSAHEPAWHPHDGSLAYTRRVGYGTLLHRLTPADGRDTTLTPTPERATSDDGAPVESPAQAEAAWSPDGAWVALTAGGAVWVVEPAAAEPARRLTRPEDHLGAADVSPDGRRLALSDTGDVWILGPPPVAAPPPPAAATPSSPLAAALPPVSPPPAEAVQPAPAGLRVVTGPPERRWGTRVTLTGHVESDGVPAAWRFEYRPAGNGTWQAGPDQPVSGSDPGAVAVAQTLTLPGTGRYAYRLAARVGAEWTTGQEGAVEAFSLRARPLRIDGGARYTRDPAVTLTVAAPPGASAVEVSNRPGFGGARRYPVGVRIRWTLEPDRRAGGLATVRVRFLGGGLDPAVTPTAAVVVDGTRPRLIALRTSTDGRVAARPGTFRAVRLALSAADVGSGVTGVQITADRRRPGRVRPYRVERIERTRADRLWVRVLDRAGNASRWRAAVLRR